MVDFHSEIQVLGYPLVMVTETIEIRSLGKLFKWGLYRKPPVTHRRPDGKVVKRGFRVLETLMDGRPAPHAVESVNQSRIIRIGDPARPISHGRHVFTIRYQTDRFVRQPKGTDELYWNVNGTWDMPIERVSLTAALPPGAKIKDSSAFTGYWGGDETGPRAKDYVMEVHGESVSCRANRPLAPGERLIVTITWSETEKQK